jgi:hypothetical protein
MDQPHSSEKVLGLANEDQKSVQTDLLTTEFDKVTIDDPEKYASGTLGPAAASSDELVSIDNDSDDGYVNNIGMLIQTALKENMMSISHTHLLSVNQ